MRTFTTEKGTELPLLNLRGKEYLEVKYRLVWFREDHPDWSIETQILSVTDVSAYAKATVRNEEGRVIATSHKFESIQGFPDFIEKAETGSIGRALALVGYGTQFCADELDEGKNETELETAEESALAPHGAPGEFLINFGRKYNGKKLKEIPKADLESYLGWLESSAAKQGAPVSKQARNLKAAFEEYYQVTEEAMPF